MSKKIGILSVLVLAVAISAYSVAGTYAKYTTTVDYSDKARVAKWGVKIGNPSNADFNLFSESYKASDDNTKTDVVSSDTGIDVVAPGTSGSFDFKITGTPEVNYTIAITDNGSEINNDISDTLKTALVFTVTDGTNTSAEVTYDQLAATINNFFDGKVFAANSSLEATTYTINWTWRIGTGSTDSTDTALGNASALAANYDAAPNVLIKLSIAATQSENAPTV